MHSSLRNKMVHVRNRKNYLQKRKADELIAKETERKKKKLDMVATLVKLNSEINELKYKP